ncbi:MAG: hypothetical protein WCT21_00255 [Patescibacteria group bacterium]
MALMGTGNEPAFKRSALLLASFVTDKDNEHSVLLDHPHNIMLNWPMRSCADVWNEGAKARPMILCELIERLECATSWPGERSSNEEGFLRECFQRIRPETPDLMVAIEHALPALIRLVFERHPDVHIWRKADEVATVAGIKLRDDWNELVLATLEDYVRMNEKVLRKDLIARRIDKIERRRAVDVLIVAFVRKRHDLQVRIDAINAHLAELAQDLYWENATSREAKAAKRPFVKELNELMLELNSLPLLDRL